MGEKVGHVMCEVNRGQRGVSNYGETDCKETDMCLCLSVEKKERKERKRMWPCPETQLGPGLKHARTLKREDPSENQLISCGSMSIHVNVYNTRPHGRMEPSHRAKL